jgi:hypothetical protein
LENLRVGNNIIQDPGVEGRAILTYFLKEYGFAPFAQGVNKEQAPVNKAMNLRVSLNAENLTC